MPAQQTTPQSGRLKLTGELPASGPASYRLDSALKLILSGEANEVHKVTGSGTVQIP
jgi:hypothetical protein